MDPLIRQMREQARERAAAEAAERDAQEAAAAAEAEEKQARRRQYAWPSAAAPCHTSRCMSASELCEYLGVSSE